MTTQTDLFIAGEWHPGAQGRTLDVLDPATDETIGTVAVAETSDLEAALAAAARGFATWREVSAYDRAAILRRGAQLLRDRVDRIAPVIVREHGKPLHQAQAEVAFAADIIEWSAEEGRRAYGRLVPGRATAIRQAVVKAPVGPVASFSPWNFPVSQAARKLTALAAGCSLILKASEETPAATAALIACMDDAGVPAGVLNLVYGVPADISSHLIAHPVIRKISFTGSIPVGRTLAALAGQHMKRATMELGGHAPVFVTADAALEHAAAVLAAEKYRNAGQNCVAPTRFLIARAVYADFIDLFSAAADRLAVGNGFAPGSQMGPVINRRRLEAIDGLVADALDKGARLVTGGERIGNTGCFYAPTVVADATPEMRAMNEEPFGPLALIMPVDSLDEAIAEANRLPVGLGAYAFSSSPATIHALSDRVNAGMLSVNHIGLGYPETPFGGMLDSGYGVENGLEGLNEYLATKLVTDRAI